METKHRPSTGDDGVKHCFALPKTTRKRVPEGMYEESIGMRPVLMGTDLKSLFFEAQK